MSAVRKIAGLLLAGGHSRRFGAEKAMADFRGRPMIEVVAERFAKLDGIVVSAPAQTGAGLFAVKHGFALIEDDPEEPAGALNGVEAGLAWATAREFTHLAVAPCDTPLLPNDLYAKLAAAIGAAPAAFVQTSDGDQPLCSLWRVNLLAALHETLATGEHPAIHDFLRSHDACAVMFEDAEAFANANTLAELDRLAAL
jgi:molybdopterin-guanine dinucleotide biosynthesis protein A